MDCPVLTGCGLTRLDAAKVLLRTFLLVIHTSFSNVDILCDSAKLGLSDLLALLCDHQHNLIRHWVTFNVAGMVLP